MEIIEHYTDINLICLGVSVLVPQGVCTYGSGCLYLECLSVSLESFAYVHRQQGVGGSECLARTSVNGTSVSGCL